MSNKKALIIIFAIAFVFVVIGLAVQSREADKLEIQTESGAVKVDAFDDKINQSNDSGTVEFSADPGKFQILHRRDSSFLISILGSPFGDVRQVAEQEFLDTLGISQEEACKLDVSVGTPLFANPVQAGEVFDLSFCE